jgi:hypothetical protein
LIWKSGDELKNIIIIIINVLPASQSDVKRNICAWHRFCKIDIESVANNQKTVEINSGGIHMAASSGKLFNPFQQLYQFLMAGLGK